MQQPDTDVLAHEGQVGVKPIKPLEVLAHNEAGGMQITSLELNTYQKKTCSCPFQYLTLPTAPKTNKMLDKEVNRTN